ncbi:hypothetical protein SBRY_50271 [Actinacidiphila bryophytorum]|uniref:Uncharacterized protein n=1 Tax=Actinacidiphila bryophytorum TaxID=1436133 RepID=A0A9W4H4E0_9ACTN|nr:hypothetical protein SBRY_50271 [Actinacidiphila bryophytorum]
MARTPAENLKHWEPQLQLGRQ